MFKILLADRETEKMKIPELLEGFAHIIFPAGYTINEDEMLRHAGEVDAIISVFGKVTNEAISLATKLKIIAVAAAGYDNVDVKSATTNGIYVTRAATASVEGVAEHALGLMICLSKKIYLGAKESSEGNWGFRETEKAFGAEINGKTAGIIGFGKVGRSLSRKLVCLGIRVLASDPYVYSSVATDAGAELMSLDQLLSSSDFICVTSSLTSETKHTIGVHELMKAKPSSFLINIARGGIVDETALFDALYQGRIAGAALDVLESEPPTNQNPLFRLKNCIITPHIAGLTVERYESCGKVATDEVKRTLNGSGPTSDNLVNPEVLMLGVRSIASHS